MKAVARRRRGRSPSPSSARTSPSVAPRTSRAPSPTRARRGRPARRAGTGERLELVLLAAADETACALGVSREELVLALRSVDELEQLAEQEGRSRDELEDALRDGLGRAVDEAEQQGLIGDTSAERAALRGRSPAARRCSSPCSAARRRSSTDRRVGWRAMTRTRHQVLSACSASRSSSSRSRSSCRGSRTTATSGRSCKTARSAAGCSRSRVAVVVNVVTYAPPWMLALPGLRFRQALPFTQASTALTYVAPGGGIVGMAGSYGLLRTWGFGSAEVARAVTLTGVWNQLANLLLPVVGVLLLSIEERAGRRADDRRGRRRDRLHRRRRAPRARALERRARARRSASSRSAWRRRGCSRVVRRGPVDRLAGAARRRSGAGRSTSSAGAGRG